MSERDSDFGCGCDGDCDRRQFLTAAGTTLGAIFIALADNMMVLRGFESGPRILFVGFIVVFSVSIYALLRRGN